MIKLIRGIIQFREARREGFAETFSRLALGQQPDALFITCSDSRVAVNVFASTDPGDLFVYRNIGNVVPPYGHPGGTGTAAAVDYAVEILRVRDIIICGHYDCGAMRAHCQGEQNLPAGPIRDWLEIGVTDEVPRGDANEASRRNVLLQIERLKNYPNVARALREGRVRLHGLWFDIPRMDVLYYEAGAAQWTVLDRPAGERILGQLQAAVTS